MIGPNSVPVSNQDGMTPPLIRALLTDPACYDHPVEKIELVETHISWVLLTGSYAYKIKKPVDLGFLDFSTLQLRHQDCIAELRLNRRLASDIYLDVVAITGTPDAPRINGSNGHGKIAASNKTSHARSPLLNPLTQASEGAIESLCDANVDEAIEYAVKMHQFPVDATLDHLSNRGELTEQHIDILAARVAHFHQTECEPAPAESPWGQPEAIARPVEENFQVLLQFGQSDSLTKLQNWCQTEHARLAPLMKQRKAGGRVRECHGDLHLANMAWVDGRLVIFDCLEFNPALRWIDVISEVAFCYMDLLHRNHPELAYRFLNAWLAAVGDYQGVALLRYYAVYRALVRAKVAALRAGQCTGSDAHTAHAELASCLQLAGQLTRSPPPFQPSPADESLQGQGQTNRCANAMLTITHGLSGSGKTTYTQQLLQRYGMIRLRSDVERKRLAGLPAMAKSESGVDEGLYAKDYSRRTYQHLAHLASDLLVAGWSVVVDAAFLERDQRDAFREIAAVLDVPFTILHFQVDPAILRERIRRRQAAGADASEADLRVLQHQLETVQPLGADEVAFSKIVR